MRAIAVGIMALVGLTASVLPMAALADEFTGVCTLSGTATLAPGLSALPKTASFSFNTDGGSMNRCSGLLNGVTVNNVVASAVATGTGSLSCSASQGTGTGTLTINGVPVGFWLTIVGTGPNVTLVIQGNVAGKGAGEASFATDSTAGGQCKAKDAKSLTFLIGAAARKLTD